MDGSGDGDESQLKQQAAKAFGAYANPPIGHVTQLPLIGYPPRRLQIVR
jgi:hypothetical protein